MPSTGLLREPDMRSKLDEDELKSLAVALKAKFAEFGVTGAVTQINPGPVVTTFESSLSAAASDTAASQIWSTICVS